MPAQPLSSAGYARFARTKRPGNKGSVALSLVLPRFAAFCRLPCSMRVAPKSISADPLPLWTRGSSTESPERSSLVRHCADPSSRREDGARRIHAPLRVSETASGMSEGSEGTGAESEELEVWLRAGNCSPAVISAIAPWIGEEKKREPNLLGSIRRKRAARRSFLGSVSRQTRAILVNEAGESGSSTLHPAV